VTIERFIFTIGNVCLLFPFFKTRTYVNAAPKITSGDGCHISFDMPEFGIIDIPLPIYITITITDQDTARYTVAFQVSPNPGQIQYDIEINSNKKAFFYLDIIFNGPDFHNPEVVAKIINLSGPKNLNINNYPIKTGNSLNKVVSTMGDINLCQLRNKNHNTFSNNIPN